MRMVGAMAALLFAAAGSACASEPGDAEQAAVVSSEVQSANVSKHFAIATSALPAVQLRTSRATGALFVPRRSADDGSLVSASDGTPIRSTCGVTFIDRTHAITAAHCADDVDVPDPPQTTLTVELYDVPPSIDWSSAATLTGTFPSYTHPTLTGVQTTSLACKVVRRCKFGPYQCPSSITAEDPDIELLECPSGLPADREPVSVAATDREIRDAVTAFWFHEIYDAPTAEPAASDSVAMDLFTHYATADESGTQNFHYFGGGRNQLLPLVSLPFPMVRGTVDRRRLGRQGTVVWTDLFACHGTSGSGVMQLNATTGRFELLGPVATASSDWGATRLCTDLALHAAGRKNASYTATEFTRAMVAGL
jgi:hypothetical protein